MEKESWKRTFQLGFVNHPKKPNRVLCALQIIEGLLGLAVPIFVLWTGFSVVSTIPQWWLKIFIAIPFIVIGGGFGSIMAFLIWRDLRK
jgi:hypothetical protein